MTTFASGLVLDGRPFTLTIAEAEGLNRAALRALVRGGALRRPFRGVFVDARVPDSLDIRCAAIAVVLPPGAAVGRSTAAALFGVDARSPRELLGPQPVQCVVPLGYQPARRPEVACFEAELPDDDVVLVGALPVTSPTRTTVDLLRWREPPFGLGAADALAHEGLILPEEVVVAVERWRGGRWTAQARYLAGLIEPLTESHGESWTRLRIIDAGLPAPQAQIVVRVGGVFRRLDLGWLELLKAVEYDGERFHSADADRRRDALRRLLIGEEGWETLVVTKEWVFGPSMELEWTIAAMLGTEPKTSRRRW